MLESTAVVATDAPERYAKQLLAHLGRKNTVETIGGERQGGRLVFAYGTATVRPEDNQLVLEAAAEDPDSLAHVEEVLARHLERFGAKRELAVTWQRGRPDGAGRLSSHASLRLCARKKRTISADASGPIGSV